MPLHASKPLAAEVKREVCGTDRPFGDRVYPFNVGHWGKKLHDPCSKVGHNNCTDFVACSPRNSADNDHHDLHEPQAESCVS
mgnify:CR=1 FL=1